MCERYVNAQRESVGPGGGTHVGPSTSIDVLVLWLFVYCVAESEACAIGWGLPLLVTSVHKTNCGKERGKKKKKKKILKLCNFSRLLRFYPCVVGKITRLPLFFLKSFY